jgi:ABC-type transporter Mla subunit MlaD
VRELFGRLDTFIGTLDGQRDDVLATVTELNRFSATLAANDATLAEALRTIPPALEVLHRQEPNLVTALDRLHVFSDTARAVINDTQAYLVRNLQNLDPTLRALADVGPELGRTLAYLTVFPLGQDIIDRGIRGDYVNLFATIDLTRNRLKRGLLSGTRFGDPNAPYVPAPGDAGYHSFYSRDPLRAGIAPPAVAPEPPPAPVPAPTSTTEDPEATTGGGG